MTLPVKLIQDQCVDVTYSESYCIDHKGNVFRNGKAAPLKPDAQGRVVLSFMHHRTSVKITDIQFGSNPANYHTLPSIKRLAASFSVNLGSQGRWKIKEPSTFLLGSRKFVEPPCPAPQENLMGDEIVKWMRKSGPTSKLKFSATAAQLLQWLSDTYDHRLLTLPPAFDLYMRPLALLQTERLAQVCKSDHNALWLINDGRFGVAKKSGQLSTNDLRPRCITYKGTDDIISGPTDPLIAWAFHGTPDLFTHELFYVSGNKDDKTPANIRWIPVYKYNHYARIRGLIVGAYERKHGI